MFPAGLPVSVGCRTSARVPICGVDAQQQKPADARLLGVARPRPKLETRRSSGADAPPRGSGLRGRNCSAHRWVPHWERWCVQCHDRGCRGRSDVHRCRPGTPFRRSNMQALVAARRGVAASRSSDARARCRAAVPRGEVVSAPRWRARRCGPARTRPFAVPACRRGGVRLLTPAEAPAFTRYHEPRFDLLGPWPPPHA